MTNTRIKLIVLAAFGLSVPYWWTMIVSYIIYGLHLLAGSPEHQTRLYGLSSLFLPSIALGLLTSYVVLLLSRERPLFGWAVFFVFLVLGVMAIALYFGTVDTVTSVFGSPSNLSFLVSSALAPLWGYYQSRSGLTSAWSRTP